MADRKNLVIENARIAGGSMRNFSGLEQRFNPAGRRNFNIYLDDSLAERLTEDGWNVKWLKAREEGDRDQAILKVDVSYNLYPPKIIRISGKTKLSLVEDTVGTLDREQIVSADLVISPSYWEMAGKSGIKAYLDTAYITVEADPFESKYVFDDGMDDGVVPF